MIDAAALRARLLAVADLYDQIDAMNRKAGGNPKHAAAAHNACSGVLAAVQVLDQMAPPP